MQYKGSAVYTADKGLALENLKNSKQWSLQIPPKPTEGKWNPNWQFVEGVILVTLVCERQEIAFDGGCWEHKQWWWKRPRFALSTVCYTGDGSASLGRKYFGIAGLLASPTFTTHTDHLQEVEGPRAHSWPWHLSALQVFSSLVKRGFRHWPRRAVERHNWENSFGKHFDKSETPNTFVEVLYSSRALSLPSELSFCSDAPPPRHRCWIWNPLVLKSRLIDFPPFGKSIHCCIFSHSTWNK